MRKKVIVRGPALTRSGYGEHTRFVLRALRKYEDLFDIYLIPVNWGQTNWIYEDNEERRWMDDIIRKTASSQQEKNTQYDISLQVTIPNEWQTMAPVNIGITAGVETTKVAPIWLEKSNMMDKVITISEFAKSGFINTFYDGIDKRTNQQVRLHCSSPIDVVHYPIKHHEKTRINLKLDTDFNFLTIAQMGPRKNIENTIKWFVEEFIDQEVGLVIKGFKTGGSIIDRTYIEQNMQNILESYENRKCKVYLLHGDMTEEEMHSLYKHPKIKALISLTHGEGFGLPLFEAAYSGLPVLAPDWSGHTDFLYTAEKNEKGKTKRKPHFARVDYDISAVQPTAVWDGVIQADSQWCYPQQGSYKMKLREIYKDYGRFKKQAKALQKWILENFKEEDQLRKMVESITGNAVKEIAVEELPKISLITSLYDADEHIEQLMDDVTRQTIFEEKCEWIIINANSPGNEEKVIQKYLKKYPNNIVYKKLDEDPGIYAVWNKAIELATGEYVTNINCDDRRTPDALEKQAKALALNSDVDLVYNDSYVVNEPNIQIENIPDLSKAQRYAFSQFSIEGMLQGNLPHNNPMWKKKLHDDFGYFEEKYNSAADWDMWLKCALGGSKFMKLNEILGIYYYNPKGISTNPENNDWKRKEELEIYKKYQKVYMQLQAKEASL
tara:strand:+ start:3866 stop:5863 length:1998 start_codon:yes stop_codon:yes gene_type:complete